MNRSIWRIALARKIWRGFCIAVVRAFYRRLEVQGLERLPPVGPVLLCANHVNALADALIIQTISPRLVHPLAKSGLFRNPLTRPVMALIQAVPVYRRQDAEDTGKNVDSFARVYDMLAQDAALLIFPEGQSHSDPHLHPFKTGAARMALGARETRGVTPALLPVGLNFTRKGKFRSSVFVEIGAPVSLEPFPGGTEETNVRGLTAALEQALAEVTINVEAWDELDLLRRIERFFAMRHGKYRKRTLAQRFRALKELIEAHRRLRRREPAQLETLREKLREFERICAHWRIRDYHLTVRYTPSVVTTFTLRTLVNVFVVLPLGFWGLLNSGLPFLLTALGGRWTARAEDQYDTAKMTLGLFLFLLFWGAQTTAVYWYLGLNTAVAYALSLPPGAAALVMLRYQRQTIWQNIRVFLLFLRKRDLRQYLEEKRREIETELARFVRLAKRRSRAR